MKFQAFTLLAGVVAAVSANAADPDFYKGKTIKMIVSTPAGGADDTYARIMADHWPEHIPGNPGMVVENLPGAGGIKAGLFLYNVAPKDGTVIAAVHSNVPIQSTLSPDSATWDPDKFNWIGSVTKDPYVGYVWKTAPIKSFAEAKTKPAIVGAQSASSVGAQFALLSNALAGTKLKLVVGYSGSASLKLAMERGEIDGTWANTWGAIKIGQAKELQSKDITIVVQHGLSKSADLPDVPLMIDQIAKEEDKQAARLAMSIQEFAKPYLAPPGVPADRVALLRKSFDETVRDPKFLANIAKRKLDVNDPLPGDKLAALLAVVNKTPPAVSKRLEAIYDEFKGADKGGDKGAKDE
jgi:tripartite-type tricarboxylate transporter receptor subunit TctC